MRRKPRKTATKIVFGVILFAVLAKFFVLASIVLAGVYALRAIK